MQLELQWVVNTAMLSWTWIIDHLAFLSIPIISGMVGWATNVLALKMTFYPIEYRGFGPIGWQGIIPSKAPKMADLSVDLMTTKLVSVEDIFSKLDPGRVSAEMSDSLKLISKQLIDEVIEAQAPFPKVWYLLPQKVRDRVYKQVETKLPAMLGDMMTEIKADINNLLDLKALAIDKLMEDKRLINSIFQNVGKKEFRFVEQSGFYFGFLFGILQMTVFYFYNPWWILPLAGVLVGYFTNFFAIFLIFNPIRPHRFLGITFQGLFVKRQKEVSESYAEIIAAKILTIEELFDYLLRGPKPEGFSEIVRKQVDTAVDEAMGEWRVLFEKTLGITKIDIVKNIVHYRLMVELPVAIRDVFDYAHKELGIEQLLSSKMTALSEIEFVNFLRPVFQEDELKLILIGAFLGGMAGTAQYFFFFN